MKTRSKRFEVVKEDTKFQIYDKATDFFVDEHGTAGHEGWDSLAEATAAAEILIGKEWV